jgi:hypothetical protein
MRQLRDQRFLLFENRLSQRERVLLIASRFQGGSLQLNDDCILGQIAIHLLEKSCSVVIFLSRIGIVCPVIESSGDCLVETRGDQRFILEFSVDAGRCRLDRVHQRLAGLAAGKWIAASQQIFGEKPVDGAGNSSLAAGIVTFASGPPVESKADCRSGRQGNNRQDHPGPPGAGLR